MYSTYKVTVTGIKYLGSANFKQCFFLVEWNFQRKPLCISTDRLEVKINSLAGVFFPFQIEWRIPNVSRISVSE